MKKELITLLFITSLIILLSSLTYAQETVDAQIGKVTHYAEQYESNNIGFIQLNVYLSSVREKINELAGAFSRHEGGLFKQEQLEKALGKPTEHTSWVWDESKKRETRVEKPFPIWRDILYDGHEINIRLGTWPSIRNNEVIYRINFEIEFKDEDEQSSNIDNQIDEISMLANDYFDNPSRSKIENLAKESVLAEKSIQKNLRNQAGQCQEIMNKYLGSENIRDNQEIITMEVILYEDQDMAASLFFEMCDNCQGHWIGTHMNINSRGRHEGIFNEEYKYDENEKSKYVNSNIDELKSKSEEIVFDMVDLLKNGDIEAVRKKSGEFQIITNAWGEKSHNIWQKVDEQYNKNEPFENEEESRKFHENYGWIRQEQERRKKVKDLEEDFYQERKEFYEELANKFDVNYNYFSQKEWEKRLFTEFTDFGEEICDNNVDDNENGQVDCEENQCGGNICGKDFIITYDDEGNEIKEELLLYCIAGNCQEKEEESISGPVCGNHICEEGEDGDEGKCLEDCTACIDHESISCEGNIIFSGEDKNGCPLTPICLDNSCESDSDCLFLCGEGICQNGACEVEELTECSEAQCVAGEEKMVECSNGDKIVKSICNEGLYVDTGLNCADGEEKEIEKELDCSICGDSCVNTEDLSVISCEETTEEFDCVATNNQCERIDNLDDETTDLIETELVECSLQTDCGNENDVCSNGQCVTLPNTIEEEIEEIVIEPIIESEDDQIFSDEENQEDSSDDGEDEHEDNEVEEEEEVEVEEEEEEEDSQENNEDSEITGNVINNFFQSFARILPFTGFSVEEGSDSDDSGDDSDSDSSDSDDDSSNSDNSESQDNSGNEDDSNSDDSQSSDDEEDSTDDESNEDSSTSDDHEESDEDSSQENNNEDDSENNYNQDYEDYEDDNNDHKEDRKREDENRREEDRKRHERECSENCERQCYDSMERPCVENCMWEGCGDELECNLDEIQSQCENTCEEEIDIKSCENECVDSCTEGKHFDSYNDQPEEQHQYEKNVFRAGGMCRQSQGGQEESFIFFDGWGEDFKNFHEIKNQFYSNDQKEWCKIEVENLIKHRKELERGFNDEFLKWFFEDYMGNAAVNWNSHLNGIYEIYWNSVGVSERLSTQLDCLGKDINELDIELISISYDTEYGQITYWEEIKEANLHNSKDALPVITPKMTLWIRPPQEIMELEMKESMEKHKLPGPDEDSEDDDPFSLSEEEFKEIKEDRGLMKKIRKLNDKYGENVVLQFNNLENDEIIYNVYIRINENEFYAEPMPYSEVPKEDVKIKIDFEEIFNLIKLVEEDIRGGETESPPWDPVPRTVGKTLDNVGDGIKMWFTFRKIINSAEVTPSKASGDAEFVGELFFRRVMGDDDGDHDRDDKFDEENDFDNDKGENEEYSSDYSDDDFFQDKKSITGEVINN